MEGTVIYLSLKALGFVEEDEGSEFVTLNTKVEGSDKFNPSVDSSRTFNAAPMTGHDRFNCDSLIISNDPFLFSFRCFSFATSKLWWNRDDSQMLSAALGTVLCCVTYCGRVITSLSPIGHLRLSCRVPDRPYRSQATKINAQTSIRLLQRLDIPIPQTYYTESDFGRVCRGCLRRDLRHRRRTPVKGMIHPTCLCVIWRMRLWI